MDVRQDFFGVAPEQFPGLMEGSDVPETDSPLGDLLEQPKDLYPPDELEHQRLVAWCNNAFTAAEKARRSYETRWKRYYQLYRSHQEKKPGDWHHSIFVPVCFWIIETVTPRLVAQLPKFTAYPVGPDDQMAAKKMETLLDWAVDQSDLYVELVKAFKSALKYGTGIIKTYHRVDKRRYRSTKTVTMPMTQQVQEFMLDPETGEPMVDFDGQPMMTTREVQVPGPSVSVPQKQTYVAYDGPAAECIDIFNFWVAPEAHDVDSARYVIHRVYKEMDYLKKKVKDGIYRLPENFTWDDITATDEDPAMERLSSIGLGDMGDDPTRKPVEILEFWTDDGRVITLVNRKAIFRVSENPFDHSEKPFVRVLDYVQEHEFWGVGEIEPLEGLQDLQNALVNTRLDNVRLVMNAMFAVNMNYIEDESDLESRPGGVIRLRGDLTPNEVIQRIDLGDVTSSAFNEAEINERTIEKVSGVSAYQMGLDSPSYNNTATGVAIIQEQGASRFGLKAKMAELMGLRRLGRHYGSIIQQFTTEDRWIRLAGPEGQYVFQHFTPESLHGGLDYDIESESVTQTQMQRQNTKQTILQLMAQYNPAGVYAALDDLLDELGVRDKQAYFQGQPTMPMPQQMPPPGGAPALPAGIPGLPPEIAAQNSAYDSSNPAAGTGGEASADARMADIQAQFLAQGQV